MTRSLAILVGCAAMVAGCDHSAPGLTQPSGSGATALSTPQLAVRIDSRGSSVAIVGVSEVTFDARATPGDKLSYEIQFGDGASATTSVATHVYATPGTFQATLTAIDAADRRSTTSATVAVKSVTGTWFYSDYNEGTRHAEGHRLAITEQQGATVRGTYSTAGELDRPFAGTLTAERTVHVVVADQAVQFDGLVPGDIQSDWSLTASGGRIGGQTLPFRRVAGDAPPAAPAPVARLAVLFDKEQSFSSRPVTGITQITFDASSSTGERLSYIIEYGDESFTREASTVHSLLGRGVLLARVTVTDAFGRFATASHRFDQVVSLRDLSRVEDFYLGWEHWRSLIRNDAANRWETRVLQISNQEGLTLTGRYMHPEGGWSYFNGTLDGHGGVEITLVGGGITFTGRARFTEKNSWGNRFFAPDLELTARGGSADGMILRFVWYDVYA